MDIFEKIDMKRVMVEVRFHIAPSKRTSPEMCIMKPLSFDVWRKTGEGVELLEIIDVEIGMFNDTPSPITLSISTGRKRLNLGILDKGAKYEQIRKKAIDVIKERHANY